MMQLMLYQHPYRGMVRHCDDQACIGSVLRQDGLGFVYGLYMLKSPPRSFVQVHASTHAVM